MKPWAEAAAAVSAAASDGWRAGLELGFRPAAHRTVLCELRHHGPLAVQRPFYPEGGVCHLYLLHPPGGVVGGDALDICCRAEAGAAVLLTTPAAQKYYRSAGAAASQRVRLRVEAGASLEWLPQESIVFDGARARAALSVELASDARFVGLEVYGFGRPAAGEGFGHGWLDLDGAIRLDGRPLLCERGRYDAALLAAPWGLRGAAAVGSLWAWPADGAVLEAARGALGEAPQVGATLVERLLLVRVLGSDAGQPRRLLEAVWRAIRPAVIGRPACAPRIWAT